MSEYIYKSAIIRGFIYRWLMSKNREAEALKSLQWLRGWVSPNHVKDEFDEIKNFNDYSKSCSACIKAERPCTHPPPTARDKFQELLRRRTMKPFIILLSVFCIGQFSGTHAMRPYMVQILRSYGSPISPNWATVCTTMTGKYFHGKFDQIMTEYYFISFEIRCCSV